MKDKSIKQTSVASPCIRQCTLNLEDICLGCHRSLTEICAWSQMSDAQRGEVLQLSAKRKAMR